MSGPDPSAVVERAFRRPAADADETCGLCGVRIDTRHSHVVNVVERHILCVCRGCYLLFTPEGAGGRRFVAVPDRCRAVRAEAVAGVITEVLQIPVGLVFFFINSHREQVVTLYPSPAGATESTLPLERWEAVVEAAPDLKSLLPDVEALLVRTREDRPSGETLDTRVDVDHAYIVPIDLCYELVGRLRRNWEGFNGGAAWRDVNTFFQDLDRRVQGALV
jgi:hypothetical protein